MRTKEYMLKGSQNKFGKQIKKQIEETEKLIDSKFPFSASEGVKIGRLIYLHDMLDIEPYSTLKVKIPQRTKIDYIKKVDYDLIQEHLKTLKKELNLSQSELKRVVHDYNNLEKTLKKRDKSIENLIGLMNITVKNTVNDKQIKEYIRNIEKHCNQLINCLPLVNPELLNKNQKDEVLNQLNVLTGIIEDFKKGF